MAAQGAFTVDLNSKPEYQRLLEGKPQTLGMRSGRVHLLPGQACGQHSTKNHEELLVFLAGQGELQIGGPDPKIGRTAALGTEGAPGARHAVGVGKVAYIPPETLHDVSNTGREPLIYIYCVAPVGS
ncbi:MAG: cupin domain-containing protein [Planctomycetes bacterium]|nr:cupin domain-containing protein [Planctomycetota bacterium]